MIIAVLILIQAITSTPESLFSVRYILWHFPRFIYERNQSLTYQTKSH